MIVSKEMVQEIVKHMSDILEPVRKASGPMAIYAAIRQAAPLVIAVVESATGELKAKGVDIKSADKKQLALDIVFAFVKLPWWFPRGIAERIAGGLIDAAVAAVNKHLGK